MFGACLLLHTLKNTTARHLRRTIAINLLAQPHVAAPISNNRRKRDNEHDEKEECSIVLSLQHEILWPIEWRKDDYFPMTRSETNEISHFVSRRCLVANYYGKYPSRQGFLPGPLVGNSDFGFRFLGRPEFGIPLPSSEFRNFPAETIIGKPENRSSRKSEFRFRFFRNSGIPLITYIGTLYLLIL
jgi:hypothetical protein